MGDKRLLVAMLLCMGVFFLWMFLYPKLFPAPPKAPPTAPSPNSQQPVTPTPGPTPTPAPQDIPPVAAVDSILLESQRYTALLSNRGAVLRELWLKGSGDDRVLLIEDLKLRAPNFLIVGLEHCWEVTEKTAATVKFKTRVGPLEYEKHVSLFDGSSDAGKPYFQVDLHIRNLTEATQIPKYTIYALNGVKPDSDYRYVNYQHGFWGYRTHPDFLSYPVDEAHYFNAQKNNQPPASDTRMAGIKNRYYAIAVIPENPDRIEKWEALPLGRGGEFEETPYKNAKILLHTAPIPLLSKGWTLIRFNVYAGPIRGQELAQAPSDMSQLLDYSGPNFVGTTILAILNFFYGIFGVYGVAIVFTTLVVRLCLFWLNKKSQISMNKMAKLQPKLSLIRERYKNDPQKGYAEQMKLYKEHKISPTAGCLPALIQLPIFIGMYSVLDISMDLRHSPFLWFNDLSQPDRLIPFGKTVHFLIFSLDAINLLPIVMTITWTLQSMMAPKSKDPQMAMQQKMLMFMPILFGFMCYDLASGLSWYFLINSLLAMAETRIIKKVYLKETPEAAPA